MHHKKNKNSVHHKKKTVQECGSSPHTAADLHYSQSVTDPDFHTELPAACGHPLKKINIIILQQ